MLAHCTTPMLAEGRRQLMSSLLDSLTYPATQTLYANCSVFFVILSLAYASPHILLHM